MITIRTKITTPMLNLHMMRTNNTIKIINMKKINSIIRLRTMTSLTTKTTTMIKLLMAVTKIMVQLDNLSMLKTMMDMNNTIIQKMVAKDMMITITAKKRNRRNE